MKSCLDCSRNVRACVFVGGKQKTTLSTVMGKCAIIIAATTEASTRTFVTFGSTPPTDTLATDVERKQKLFCASNHSLKLCKGVASPLVGALQGPHVSSFPSFLSKSSSPIYLVFCVLLQKNHRNLTFNSRFLKGESRAR